MGGEVGPAAFGLPAPDRPLMGVGGRGLDLQAAFEGCIGEAAQYLSFLEWGDEALYRAAPAEAPLSRSDTGDWVLAAIGLERESSDQEVPLEWIEAQRLGASGALPIPADLCLRREPPAGGPVTRRAESNGCATGPTLEAAQRAALLELIERDAVALWWYGGRAAPSLALEPRAQRVLADFSESLRASASRRHWLLDITTDIAVPAVAALSCDEEGAAVIGGFSADPDPLVAARGALLEMCQMELALDLVQLKIEQRGQEALNDGDRLHLERLQRLRLEAYPLLSPAEGDREAGRSARSGAAGELSSILAAIEAAGFEAYWIDLSRAELAVPAVRVLVPGLQSPKPDWVSGRLRDTAIAAGVAEAERRELPPII